MKLPFQHIVSSKTMNSCIERITEIRRKSDILAICPAPTGYSWLGVQVATLSLFSDCTFQITQNYSNQTLTDERLAAIAQIINDLNFKQVVFSGFLPYFAKLINSLKPAVTIKILYHGFLSELSGNEKQTVAFAEMLKLLKSKKIQVVGCVKKGLAQSLSKMFGIRACEIILPNKSIATDIIPMTNDVNIGCLVNTSFRKNIHNQATAALMAAKSTIHVFETKELEYYDIAKN